MRIDRRNFLRLFGTAVGGITLASTGLSQTFEVPEKLLKNLKTGPGIVTWKSTICGMCNAGCGLKIKTVDGLPVYVKGNPTYPVNSGGVCPAAHGALEVLYHPERLTQPLRRIGIAGENKFIPVSWEEALNEIISRLKKLRAEDNPERLAIITNNDNDISNLVINKFAYAFGTPNYFNFSYNSNNTQANYLQTGVNSEFDIDISKAQVILTLEADILGTDLSPVYFTKQFSSIKEESEGRVRFIHVGSHLNLTGMSANQFVPIKHETVSAFALGLAFVLIKEDLIDNEFIKKYSFGFEKWQDKNGKVHEGFKDYILKNYYPEKVSKITSVPSSTIIYIARLLGNNKPSIAIGGNSLGESTHGVYTHMAVNALNALLGNFSLKNGLIHFPNPEKFDPPKVDEKAKKGLERMRVDSNVDTPFNFSGFSISDFANNINRNTHYPIEALFLVKSNPVFQSINKRALTDALKKIPFVVSFDSFLNETNVFADYILPIDTFLEEWNIISESPGIPFTHAGVRQPVVDRFHDTKSVTELFGIISKGLGNKFSNLFDSNSPKEIVQEEFRKIYSSGKGAITREKVSGQWLNFIKSRGWHIGRYESFDDFWKQLLNYGGWWNPEHNSFKNNSSFRTPTGKFEFYSRLLEEEAGKLNDKNLEKLNIYAKGDLLFLPHFESQEDGTGSLQLVLFRNNVNKDGSLSNIPLLQELFGLGIKHYWDTWVEMNKITSLKYGLNENDDVIISSEYGSIKAKVKIIRSMPDNTVAVPIGQGHTNFGKYANGFGADPTTLLKDRFDIFSGKQALQSGYVNISKTEQGA